MRKSSWAMGARRGRLSAPWLRFHGVGRADVYIIIRVRASGCGESALNPPTSPPIPHRRSAPVPAQRRALPEHFLTPFPRTSARPRSPDAHPQAARCIPRRPHNTFPVEDLLPPPHSDAHCPSTSAPHAAPTHARRPHHPFPAEGRRPSPQRRTLPEHFLTPFPHTSTPLAAPTHARRPHHPFPAEGRRPSPHSDALPEHFLTPFPSTFAPPRSADARPPTSPPIPRRRSAPAPAQRHALPLPSCSRPSTATRTARAFSHPLPEHFRSPTQRRRTPAASQHIPRRRSPPLPFCSASGTKKRHRTVDVRCRMSRSTVVAVGHWGW